MITGEEIHSNRRERVIFHISHFMQSLTQITCGISWNRRHTHRNLIPCHPWWDWVISATNYDIRRSHLTSSHWPVTNCKHHNVNFALYITARLKSHWQWFGLVVMSLGASTRLLYAKPG